VKLVSEAIDDLLAQMTDVATGSKLAAKARKTFYSMLRRGTTEEVAWVSALRAAGASTLHHRANEAADSLVMGGWDYAGIKKQKSPEEWELRAGRPGLLDQLERGAFHDFFGCDIPEPVARQLVQLWSEYYSSPGILKQVSEAKKPSTKGFEQIGGDFGDPWASGGTWYNAETGNIIHHDELTDKEWTGVQAEDKRIDSALTQQNYQNIARSLSAERNEVWEDVESAAREAHADVFNANRKFPYYRMVVERDEVIEKDWADAITDIKAQFENGEEIWSTMPPAQKLMELANYLGWHEFDYSPDSATKAELSVILGIDL